MNKMRFAHGMGFAGGRGSAGGGRRSILRGMPGHLALLGLLAWVGGASAQMLESFEYGVPPAGWTKTNLLGGSGWYQLPIGVMNAMITDRPILTAAERWRQ